MIVTIDGPAGAGKSTVARALAQRLGFEFLDTGAMYRAVALAAQQANVAVSDERQLSDLLEHLRLEMTGGRVILNGEDVSSLIRTPRVTALSRAVADSPVVRQHLGRLQRQIASGRNLVTEGRDQGTVVFPDAGCKFFLTADPVERARRRHGELRGRGEQVTLEDVLHAQEERDARDAARTLAPMVPAHDAILVDSSQRSIEQVLELLERHVRERMATTS